MKIRHRLVVHCAKRSSQVLEEYGKIEKFDPWGDGIPQEGQHPGPYLAGHTIGVVCYYGI